MSLGWNIYRDVLLKAKATVSVGIKSVFHGNEVVIDETIGISVVNHGPGPLILDGIYVKNRSLWRRVFGKTLNAFIMHDYENPYSAKMPKKLDVGETANYYLNFDKNCFLKSPFNQIGLSDTFGRMNWARKSELREIRKTWLKKFGKDS